MTQGSVELWSHPVAGLGVLATALGLLGISSMPLQDDPRVDAIFAEFMGVQGPGCAVMAAREGEVLATGGYGFADLDHSVPITPETVFYIGSEAKQFAAVAMALAEREGFLSLEDDIRMYLPEFPDHGSTIRILDLIHHTAGLRDYLTLWAIAGRQGDFHTDEALLELLARQEALHFPPREGWMYSNSGYVLLTTILERAAGMGLREYARTRIFEPLGMTDSRFVDSRTRTEPIPRRATGYAPRAGGGYEIRTLSNFDKLGDGGMYSTVADLLRWDRHLREPTLWDHAFGERLLEPVRLANGEFPQLADGTPVQYGFALDRREYRGAMHTGHGGGYMGFRAVRRHFPVPDFTVIVLCNSEGADPQELAFELVDLYLEEVLPEPPTRAEDAPPPPATSGEAAEGSPPGFTEAELAELPGHYYSRELDLWWEVVRRGDELKGDGLVVIRPVWGEAALEPLGDGVFRMDRGTLRLELDPEGTPALVLDAGRASGMRLRPALR